MSSTLRLSGTSKMASLGSFSDRRIRHSLVHDACPSTQDLAKRTLCSRADRDLSSSGDEAAVFDIVAHTFRQQQR